MTDQDSKRQHLNIEKQKQDLEERKQRFDETIKPLELTTKGLDTVVRGAGKGRTSHYDDKGRKTQRGQGNHPSWYMKFVNSSWFAGIPFGDVAGRNEKENPAVNGGLLVLNYLPNLPILDKGNPAQEALLIMLEFIRSVNAGARNYEPSDIGILLLATNEIIAQYGELARIYGLLNSVDAANRWYTRYAVEALAGESLNTVVRYKPEILSALHRVETLMAGTPLPNISLFERTFFMTTKLFKDENLSKSKLIAYAREGFGIFRPAGLCKNVDKSVVFHPVQNNINGRITDLMQSVNALLDSSDFVTIMGDIMKAYGANLVIPHVDEKYITVPEFDQVVLQQIENTTLVGAPCWPDAMADINHARQTPYDFQDYRGVIVQGSLGNTTQTPAAVTLESPYFCVAGLKSAYPGYTGAVLDAHVDQPSAEDVFVYTRGSVAQITQKASAASIEYLELANASGTVTPQVVTSFGAAFPDVSSPDDVGYNWRIARALPTDSTVKYWYPKIAGTEVFTTMSLFMWAPNKTDGTQITGCNIGCYYGVQQVAHSYSMTTRGFLYATMYVHHPQMRMFNLNILEDHASPSFTAIGHLTGNNATYVSAEVLGRIHYAAVYSEFVARSGSKG